MNTRESWKSLPFSIGFGRSGDRRGSSASVSPSSSSVTVGGWLWAITSHFQRIELERLGEEFSKRAEKTWPVIADELGRIVDGVLPEVEARFFQQLEEAAPDIAKRFKEEAHNLDRRLNEEIEASRRRQLTAENRAEAIRIVRAVFPEYGDEATTAALVASLQDSFLRYAQKKLLALLSEYHDTFQQFAGTFERVKAERRPGLAFATLHAVLDLWLDVMQARRDKRSEVEAEKTARNPAQGQK